MTSETNDFPLDLNENEGFLDSYLSEEFITGAGDETKLLDKKRKSIRPLLPLSKKEKARRIEELMHETRKVSSEKAISESNVGNKLLQKFGYSGVGGLGKEGNGIAEPILLKQEVTCDKFGIGIKESILSKQRAMNEKKAIENNNIIIQEYEFKTYASSQYHKQAVLFDLSKAEKVISELDERKGVPSHSLWPIQSLADDCSTDDNRSDASIKLQNCIQVSLRLHNPYTSFFYNLNGLFCRRII